MIPLSRRLTSSALRYALFSVFTLHSFAFAQDKPSLFIPSPLLRTSLHSSPFTCFSQIKTGADLLLTKHLDLIEGKRVGLVTNHTGVLSSGKHLADALSANSAVRLVALFAPEHGIRGDAPGGVRRENTVDRETDVPIFSLYGATYKPTAEMLKNVDVLLFDIQDVGARYYTYTSTLSYAMEAAAENGIPFVVLDRPNPIRGTRVEGFVREDSLRSFVGLHPIPIIHGMTTGELARLFNGGHWLANGVQADLTVVPMEGWKRTLWYDETGLPWNPPSPNMPSLSTAVVYPGMCLVEGTNVSEGRGTANPFETIGAPFVDGSLLAKELNNAGLPGVVFDPITFTPRAIAGAAPFPKHEGRECGGVFVRVVNRDVFEPVRTGVYLLAALKENFPKNFEWKPAGIDRLAGTKGLRESIDAGIPPEEIAWTWKEDVKRFLSLRKKYLLY